nr:MAG TPA: Beta-casein like protein [Caudoviricetes sp.]
MQTATTVCLWLVCFSLYVSDLTFCIRCYIL